MKQYIILFLLAFIGQYLSAQKFYEIKCFSCETITEVKACSSCPYEAEIFSGLKVMKGGQVVKEYTDPKIRFTKSSIIINGDGYDKKLLIGYIDDETLASEITCYCGSGGSLLDSIENLNATINGLASDPDFLEELAASLFTSPSVFLDSLNAKLNADSKDPCSTPDKYFPVTLNYWSTNPLYANNTFDIYNINNTSAGGGIIMGADYIIDHVTLNFIVGNPVLQMTVNGVPVGAVSTDGQATKITYSGSAGDVINITAINNDNGYSGDILINLLSKPVGC